MRPAGLSAPVTVVMFWLLKALCGTVSKRSVIIKRIHCDIACPVPVAGPYRADFQASRVK
ncbi:hypothetical protein DMI69_16890 [Escherichia coli]|nr:hypothetical protein [Escherichia coli]